MTSAKSSATWFPRVLGVATAAYSVAIIARPDLFTGPTKLTDRGETPREVFEANLLESLRKGVFDNLVVEADVRDEPKTMELVPGGAAINLGSIFGEMLPPKKKRRTVGGAYHTDVSLSHPRSRAHTAY